MTSPLPSPLKSPAEATSAPNRSESLCPFRITLASASARLVPVIPPKKIKALPESLAELLSSNLAPTITSLLPSPLKSPAEATSRPNASPALCPFRITLASASARLVPVTPPKKIKALPESLSELLSSLWAPIMTSSLPSTLKSPAEATE